jgi:hypothetical protein
MYSTRCLIEMVGASNMFPHFNLIHTYEGASLSPNLDAGDVIAMR